MTRLSCLCCVALVVAAACDLPNAAAPPMPNDRVAATDAVAAISGGVVQLGSPADFGAGAVTFDFEDMFPGGTGSGPLARRIPGLTFYDATVTDPLNIGNSRGVLIPPASGTGAAYSGGVDLRFQQPVTEAGMFVSFGFITCCTVRIFTTIHLHAYDQAGAEIGAVSVPVLHVTNNVSDLLAFRPVFIGLRSSQPIARIAADNDLPPNTNGAAIIFDDLTVFPPPPPPTDTDGDGVLDPSDNCRDTPNPDQVDTDHDGAGDACDADDDADGIADVDDRCPLENPAGRDANADGCVDRIGDLADVIAGLDLADGVANSLLSKAANAESKLASGQANAARNMLSAMINEISAQRGKAIAEGNAAMLLALLANVLAGF